MKIKFNHFENTSGDLLPLMDCMFILLIYFIFSMLDMTSYPGIKVEPPEAYTSSKSTDPYNIINILETGIYLNKKKITINDLEDELQLLDTEDLTLSGKKLYISAHKDTDTHIVFAVLEKLRVLGKKNIFIETTKKSNLKQSFSN